MGRIAEYSVIGCSRKAPRKSFLEAIRHTYKMAHARVVVLASSASPEEEATVRKMGVDLYRDKPAGLDEFEQVAKEILAICKDHSLSTAV